MSQENKNQNQQQDINQLLKVRREKLAALQEAGKDPFLITKFEITHHSQEIKDHFDELEGNNVTIAGRMMFKRVMGKASFCNIQDLQGNSISRKAGKHSQRLQRNLAYRSLH